MEFLVCSWFACGNFEVIKLVCCLGYIMNFMIMFYDEGLMKNSDLYACYDFGHAWGKELIFACEILMISGLEFAFYVYFLGKCFWVLNC